MGADLSLFQFIYQFAHRSRTFDWLGVFFAEYFPFILLLSFLAVIVKLNRDWKRRMYYLSFSLLALLVSRGLITEIIRFVHPRERPFAALEFEPLAHHLADPGFPSGHTVIFFTIAFSIFFIFKERKPGGWLSGNNESATMQENKEGIRYATWFFLGALLMGVARVFIGVHWPLDILGGILVALLGVIFVRWVLPLSK